MRRQNGIILQTSRAATLLYTVYTFVSQLCDCEAKLLALPPNIGPLAGGFPFPLNKIGKVTLSPLYTRPLRLSPSGAMLSDCADSALHSLPSFATRVSAFMPGVT